MLWYNLHQILFQVIFKIPKGTFTSPGISGFLSGFWGEIVTVFWDIFVYIHITNNVKCDDFAAGLQWIPHMDRLWWLHTQIFTHLHREHVPLSVHYSYNAYTHYSSLYHMNMNTFSTQISIVMIMTHSMLSIIVLNPKSILNDGFTGCTSILIVKVPQED